MEHTGFPSSEVREVTIYAAGDAAQSIKASEQQSNIMKSTNMLKTRRTNSSSSKKLRLSTF